MRRIRIDINIFVIALILFISGLPNYLQAQYQYKWMNVGSLHNWFSEIGCEIEVGRSSSANQQDGLQWPALYRETLAEQEVLTDEATMRVCDRYHPELLHQSQLLVLLRYRKNGSGDRSSVVYQSGPVPLSSV